MTKLADAHVVITGGSSGIGLAAARQLVAKRARVSLIARDEVRLSAAAATLEAIAREATSAGSAHVAFACADVTRATDLQGAIADVAAQQGPCDILITSAGASHPGYFEHLDDAVFRDQMEVDYFGTLHAVRAVTPSMIERGRGHLVTISSTAGLIGVFGFSAYGPAKFAVRGLAETLRAELAPHGIVVACVYPPDTRTPGFDAENALKPPETERISAAIKPRDADHVARAIVAGIEKDRLVITADVQTAALARAAGLLGPYLRRTMDRQVRKTRTRD